MKENKKIKEDNMVFKLKIGDKEYAACNSCPAFKWQEETMKIGNNGFMDDGFMCEFGAFYNCHDFPMPIPDNCPLRIMTDEILSLKNRNAELIEELYEVAEEEYDRE